MYQALEVKEIRQEITSHLHFCPLWKRRLFPISEAGFKDDRTTILHWALACKTFSEELMPVLWHSLEDIRYLFRLVPGYHEPDSINIGSFSNALTSVDVQRYLHYSTMVRELAWNFLCGNVPQSDRPDVWTSLPSVTRFQPLLSALPTESPRYLLPQLKAVYGSKGRYRLPQDLCPSTHLESLFVMDSLSIALDQDKPTDEWITMSLTDALSPSQKSHLNLTTLKFPSVLCEICSPELAATISSLIRCSPALLHFTGALCHGIEETLFEVRPQLLTLDVTFGTSSRIFGLVNVMASSLKCLRILCDATTDTEQELQITSLPSLRELHISALPALFKLLSLRLPQLTTLGFILDQYVDYIPDIVPQIAPALHQLNDHGASLASQITNLSIDVRVMPFVGQINVLLDLFPNVETLGVATGFQWASWFAFISPSFSPENYPAHPRVKELRIHHEAEALPAREMLDAKGELRMGLPRLERLVIPGSVLQAFRDAAREAEISKDDPLGIWALENSVREAVLHDVETLVYK